MKVIESVYGDDGYIETEKTLNDVFLREISNSSNPLEKCAEILSNICEMSILKGETTVKSVSEDILGLESNNDRKNPRLKEHKVTFWNRYDTTK
jgi:hypothetical protein